MNYYFVKDLKKKKTRRETMVLKCYVSLLRRKKKNIKMKLLIISKTREN